MNLFRRNSVTDLQAEALTDRSLKGAGRYVCAASASLARGLHARFGVASLRGAVVISRTVDISTLEAQ